jgi:para-aminobenzoate synthetase/4-amino-4-deoxychorismate lyase
MADGPPLDRRRGLFETLLVVAGRPVELEAHLARLGASYEKAFRARPPADLEECVRARCRGLELGRLRLTVAPAAAGPTVEIAVEPVTPATVFPAWENGARLRSRLLPGGLGPHKWADRRRLGNAPPPALPLLVDRGGEVLEASRANIFVVRRGVLLTPPADGRILPGIARAAVIAAAAEAGIAVREAPLRREELLGAEEVFLTGSVRGIEPARALDGQPLAAATAVSRRLAATLRGRWFGARREAGRSLVDAAGPGRPAR